MPTEAEIVQARDYAGEAYFRFDQILSLSAAPAHEHHATNIGEPAHFRGR